MVCCAGNSIKTGVYQCVTHSSRGGKRIFSDVRTAVFRKNGFLVHNSKIRRRNFLGNLCVYTVVAVCTCFFIVTGTDQCVTEAIVSHCNERGCVYIRFCGGKSLLFLFQLLLLCLLLPGLLDKNLVHLSQKNTKDYQRHNRDNETDAGFVLFCEI